jgi:hypothetical protein
MGIIFKPMLSSKKLRILSLSVRSCWKSDCNIHEDIEHPNSRYIDYPIKEGDSYIAFFHDDDDNDRYQSYFVHTDTFCKIAENNLLDVETVKAEKNPLNQKFPFYIYITTKYKDIDFRHLLNLSVLEQILKRNY